MLVPKNKRTNIGPFLDVGLQLAAGFGLGFGMGWWVDGKLHTLPLFSILGLMLGAAGGLLNVYRAVYPSKKRNKDADKS